MSTLYEQIGGEPTVRALVDRFYDLMDTLPEAAGIRALHPADLTDSREKLMDFLCGWLGGPPRYAEKHGHPRLRMRHLPFPIGTPEAEAWMRCMLEALDETVEDARARGGIAGALGRLALHLRNR